MLNVHAELTELSDPADKKSPIAKTGESGILNEQQIVWMILNKVGIKHGSKKEYESNIKTAINKMLAEKGTATPFKFDSLTIYHASSGVEDQVGCSLFYVEREHKVAKIVGIGYHVGAQTYELDWVEGKWARQGAKVTLDK
jgi:hypothetical protein